MKILVTFVLAALLYIQGISAQITEIECTVYRRAGAYITLTPAHYDQASLPQLGDKVMLSLYVKDNLPLDKQEGYYELFIAEAIKLIPETKSITFKAEQDLETAKVKHGFSTLSLTQNSRVKISWGR